MTTRGATIWFTGLPSSGKTTLASALGEALRDRRRDVELLDGDEVREYLSSGLGFSRPDRDTNVTRIGWVARTLASHGVLVLAAVISPYTAAREKVRALHGEVGVDFVEVHVATPLAACVHRDVKGLYAKQARGDLVALTGVDDPYEPPAAPDVRIDTTQLTVSESVTHLLAALIERGLT